MLHWFSFILKSWFTGVLQDWTMKAFQCSEIDGFRLGRERLMLDGDGLSESVAGTPDMSSRDSSPMSLF